MAFTDTIKALPFTPRTPNGSGFLPPMFRGSMHVLHLLSCIADDKVTVSDDEILVELREAQAHWNARTKPEAVSTPTAEKAELIGKALGEAITEFGKWNKDARIANLRDLGHRMAQFSADLSRELVGEREADAGTSL